MKRFSDRFKLNIQDWIKGLIMSVGGAVFAVVESSIDAGIWVFDWNNIWHVALGAGIVYIGKQFVTGQPKVVEIDSTKTEVKEISK